MSLPQPFCVPLERDLIRLTGRDRQSFLQGMVTNEVATLTPGQGCYAFHLTSKGQILADCRISCLDDALLLDTEPGWGTSLAESLEHHLVMERVKLSQSTEIVYQVFGSSDEELASEGSCRTAGAWLVVKTALGLAYYGARAPELTIHHEQTYDAWRIEAGIPRGRVDFDEKTLAPETGQAARAIHYKKGCYIGQEVVARLDARGHTNRSLVKLTLKELVAPKTPLIIEGKEVGWVTSSALSPSQEVPIALGYLRNEYAVPGRNLLAGEIEGTLR